MEDSISHVLDKMIMKCGSCGNFTLSEEHCSGKTEKERPPKFSFPDKYGKYRRKAKKEHE
ncbi:MAG: nucleolar RNA-binding Nop10p family protein [Candidatus Nanohaloarchaea archaeon]